MAERPASRAHGAVDPDGPIAAAILTVSDTRSAADDPSGDAIRDALESAGHVVEVRSWVPDEAAAISKVVRGWCASPDVEAVMVTGGTGLARRDRTLAAIGPLFETPIEGFGELFRMLSWEQVGPRAQLSRAAAGVVAGRPVWCLPGSPRAVGLAMERLVVPVLRHVVGELRR